MCVTNHTVSTVCSEKDNNLYSGLVGRKGVKKAFPDLFHVLL